MSLEDKIKAAAKNVEGKLEAAAGELTGDTQMKVEGQAKQAQAAAAQVVEDVKDQSKGVLDAIKDKIG
ncbi:MAG: CsbD family protein [Snowella sp.]|nr:CsbD family protein [Snowella sp.]